MGNSSSISAHRKVPQAPAERFGPQAQHARAPQHAKPGGQTRLTNGLAAPGPLAHPSPRQAAAPTANPHPAHLLPEELVGHIASYLPLQQLRQVGQLGHRAQAAHRELMSLEAPCLAVLAQIESVVDLAGFECALGNIGDRGARHLSSISNLRQDLRNAPLLALTSRIAALPEGDRPAARVALLAAIHSVESKHQSAALRGMERIARHGNAALSIHEGESLRQIIAFHALHDADQIAALRSRVVIDHARPAVYAAQNVRDVAERYGLDEEDDIAFLEACSASSNGPAGREVEAGANLRAVARSYGIRTARGIGSLEIRACRVAAQEVRMRGNVQEIARHHGIESAAKILHLESMAIREHAGRAVARGRNVEAVARASGITSAAAIEVLESYAMDRHVAPALKAGGHVREIAKAAGSAVRNG